MIPWERLAADKRCVVLVRPTPPTTPAVRPLAFRRVGVMTYEVRYDDRFVGHVWRTRTGWSATAADNRVVVRDYPGSRAVAAGVLAQHASDRMDPNGD